MNEWPIRAIVYFPEAATFTLTPVFCFGSESVRMQDTIETIRRIWHDESGQDIAEYAVMLAVILLIVIGTVKLIGTNANSTFSNVASNLNGG